MSSPTEKTVTRQDSTTDSLTHSEDSDVMEVTSEQSNKVDEDSVKITATFYSRGLYFKHIFYCNHPFVEAPVEESKPVEEEKPKTTFSAYSNYFN